MLRHSDESQRKAFSEDEKLSQFPMQRRNSPRSRRLITLVILSESCPLGFNVLPVKDAPRDEVHLAFESHRLAGRRGGFGCDSSGKDGLLARLDVYSCHVSPDRMNPPEPLLVYFMIPLHILTLVFLLLTPINVGFCGK